MGNFWENWIQSSNDLFASWTKSLPAMAVFSPKPGGVKNRLIDSLETMTRRWSLTASVLHDPQMTEAVLQGVVTLPEFFLKVAKSGWESATVLQKKAVEKAGKIGEKVEAYHFDNLDEGLFKAWKEIYEEEFHPYFNIPHLGLTRYRQERFNRFIDQAILLEVTVSEFLLILYLPMEQSFKVLQDKVDEMSQEGKLPEKSKEYCHLWIKILEGHYMNLFKSEAYLRILQETLGQIQQFTVAKNRFVEDVLEILPVPTNKEMDELCKELYILKKRVKLMEKTAQSREEARQLRARVA